MKRVLLAVLLILSAVGVQTASAEGPVTANIGVNMSYVQPIVISSQHDLNFRVNRNVAKAGHYVEADLGFGTGSLWSHSAGYLTPGAIHFTAQASSAVLVTLAPVSLSDGSGHTATLQLKAYGAIGTGNADNDATMTGTSDGTAMTAILDETGAFTVTVVPTGLDFASGSDVASNSWTGSTAVTLDYTDAPAL